MIRSMAYATCPPYKHESEDATTMTKTQAMQSFSFGIEFRTARLPTAAVRLRWWPHPRRAQAPHDAVSAACHAIEFLCTHALKSDCYTSPSQIALWFWKKRGSVTSTSTELASSQCFSPSSVMSCSQSFVDMMRGIA